ncbi:MAG: low affinity iron permease family protein [Chthoniobacterales bacterium]
MKHKKSKSMFSRFAHWTSLETGKPPAFGFAVIVILIWGITGPLFNYSDTWQLVINTSTTIITFLMVFLIQNTQNRDSEEIHVKLDELIRAIEGAENSLLDLEKLDETELHRIREQYTKLATAAEEEHDRRRECKK